MRNRSVCGDSDATSTRHENWTGSLGRMHFTIETREGSLSIDRDGINTVADSDSTKTSLPYLKANSDPDNLERLSSRLSAADEAHFYMECSGKPPPHHPSNLLENSKPTFPHSIECLYLSCLH